jgi:hypothetical protein
LTLDDWRGLEQASLLVGHLEHKPAANQLIQLLTHPRQEVAVSTAWALGKLRIPETYPQLLAHATAQHARIHDNQTAAHQRLVIAFQLTQLFQIFGDVRLREADPLLRNYVPKAMELAESRSAACWALGKIHEGENVPDLVQQFDERLCDVNSMPPELNSVRTMCSLGLGRMKGESALPSLTKFSGEGNKVGMSCRWSIHLLTGKKLPEPAPSTANILGWFLQPVDD